MFILVIGASGSGKSEFAEKIAMDLAADGKKMYIATMLPSGDDARYRIERHRKLRQGKGFFTLESYQKLHGLMLNDYNTILVECLSNLLANEMDSSQIQKPTESVLSGIEYVKNHCQNLVLVTNNIFAEDIDYDWYTKRYTETLGKMNIKFAKEADAVYEVVCGIPIKIKGKDI